jgi:hypothetical protein
LFFEALGEENVGILVFGCKRALWGGEMGGTLNSRRAVVLLYRDMFMCSMFVVEEGIVM